jgi:methylenetetrahydrofolate dehydrogenase (NADP+)/methenyltetrahydrofolate cyclohydrolase
VSCALARILESKPILESKIAHLKEQVDFLKQKGIVPHLKIILVGNSPASQVYTRNKKIFAEKINALCEIISFQENITKEQFEKEILRQCDDPAVDGVLVQLPLPEHLSSIDLHSLVSASKDVDCFHYSNLGKLLASNDPDKFLPCTPKGILTLCQYYGIDLKGKNVVIIGRSLIVGKPLALLLTQENCTVTLCHSQTKNIREFTQNADIVVVAIGRAKYLDKTFLSPQKKTVLIDVGINAVSEKKICGDIDFEDVLPHCEAITPVPGGVGPLTILSLAENLLISAKKRSLSRDGKI